MLRRRPALPVLALMLAVLVLACAPPKPAPAKSTASPPAKVTTPPPPQPPPPKSLATNIVFDGSPGTAAPPATLGPFTMTPFGTDARPTLSVVTDVADPAGTVGFAPSVEHDRIGNGWGTWSHGYGGDVYWTRGGTSLTLTMPSGTDAFYFYAEPVLFTTFNLTVTAQDGSTSGAVAVNGFGGATYFGFYGTNGVKVQSISITSTSDFAVGEFGIAVAPKLTIVKSVTNNNGGTAGPGVFGLSVGGNPVSSGVASTLVANTPYVINEAGLAGYTFVSITGSAKCPLVLGGTITLALGDDITCTITNDDVAPPPPPQQRKLTELSDVHTWLTTRSFDSKRAPVDLRAELLENGTPVASGLTRCVAGLPVFWRPAKEVVVSWDAFDPVPVTTGDVLALRLSARVGTAPDDSPCVGVDAAGGDEHHRRENVVRLYYDGLHRASGFDMTIAPHANTNVYLRSHGSVCGFFQSFFVTKRTLDATAPSAPFSKCRDSPPVRLEGGNPWREIGVWSMAPQP